MPLRMSAKALAGLFTTLGRGGQPLLCHKNRLPTSSPTVLIDRKARLLPKEKNIQIHHPAAALALHLTLVGHDVRAAHHGAQHLIVLEAHLSQ